MHEKEMAYLGTMALIVILFGGLFLINLPQSKANSTEISRDIIVSIDGKTWSCYSYMQFNCGITLYDCIDNFNDKVASIGCANNVKFYSKEKI